MKRVFKIELIDLDEIVITNILDEEYQVHGTNLGPERYFRVGAKVTL